MKKTLLTLAMGLGLTLGATAEGTLNDRVEARLKPILGPGADVIEVVPHVVCGWLICDTAQFGAELFGLVWLRVI